MLIILDLTENCQETSIYVLLKRQEVRNNMVIVQGFIVVAKTKCFTVGWCSLVLLCESWDKQNHLETQKCAVCECNYTSHKAQGLEAWSIILSL